MKKGTKLCECAPVITEYEDVCGFPNARSGNSYCKEMNNQSFGRTVEKVKPCRCLLLLAGCVGSGTI